ncbi:MAG TPA: maltotransferase domain-containing protein, partial [Chloroflexia bacterium]|nr:maltotransferase domain-containing protein [Chloroflexia bacterium]
MPYDMVNKRVIIRGVEPEIESGRYPIKRVIGEKVVVEADVFTDGHEAVSAELLWRGPGEGGWNEQPMEFLVNDRWRAEFIVEQLGTYEYTIVAWLDHFKFWSRSLVKRIDAGQDVSVDLAIGADLVDRAAGSDAPAGLAAYEQVLRAGGPQAVEAALSDELAALMYRHTDRSQATTYDRVLGVTVDPVRARFSAWYEFFPRSCWEPGCTHGTFRDCEKRLPRIAEMGFDVVYLPPIHPIGTTKRKGKNNSVVSEPGDVGSPWAIGSELGGHKAVNPDLGTLEDFRHFVEVAAKYDIDVALDIAFQCSPDHPYVREHPEWFRM